MNAIFLKLNEHFFLFQWMIVFLGIVLIYMLIREVFKLFSRVEDEMWGKRDRRD